jgi:Mce-associated membrane protein
MQPASGTDRRTGVLAVGVVALVVLVLGVAASGIIAYRSAHLTDSPFSFSNNGSVIPSSSERANVLAVAQEFAVRMDAVNGKDPATYVKRVSELLTTKQKTKFTGEFAQFQKVGVAADIRGTGTVLSSGVAEMDADSATVLVAHDASVVSAAGTTQRHYRWTVVLRKVGSKWLVDDFTQVS